MNLVPKSSNFYNCEICDYVTSRKSQYDRHLTTLKHKILINPNEKVPKVPDSKYVCKCGKEYKHLSSLCHHKKSCEMINDQSVSANDKDKIIEDMLILMKEMMMGQQSMMKEQQNQFLEWIPKLGNTTNMNCNNTTNNQFNLNVFLNETCKDAMNIDDFAKSVAINMDDLYFTEKNGMTQGLITLIINKLKTMDITERPMHCTDLKREVIYVKKDKWIKDENNDIMKNTIYMVSAWQLYKLKEWINLHPDVYDNEECLNEYSKLANVLYKQVEGNDTINKKVLRSVADFIYIDKNSFPISKVT